MTSERTEGGRSEPARKGAVQQVPQPSQQQAQPTGGLTQRQPRAREAREGLSRHERFEPGALLSRGFTMTPFSFMRRMMDDFDRLLEEYALHPRESSAARRELWRSSAGREIFWEPDVDVFEREGNLVVRADLPGISRDDVRVEAEDGELVIEGERHQEREVETSGTYRAERLYGTFRRAIPLPEGVNLESAKANFEKGVLEVSVPLSDEKARRKRIEIEDRKQTTMH